MRSWNFEVSILRNQSFSKQKFAARFHLIHVTHDLISVPPIHCLHPSMMNVPELKLLSSSSSIDSVSSTEEEADKGKDGNEEGRNTGNSTKSKTNSSSMDDTEEEQPQENPAMQQ